MYEVIRAFADRTDDNRLYQVGDQYPAEGVKPTKARVKELLTGTNSMGKKYIREVEDPKEPEKTGDGQTPDPEANPED